MAHKAGPDWMAKLPEHLWDVPLRTLAIPGIFLSIHFAAFKILMFILTYRSIKYCFTEKKDLVLSNMNSMFIFYILFDIYII